MVTSSYIFSKKPEYAKTNKQKLSEKLKNKRLISFTGKQEFHGHACVHLVVSDTIESPVTKRYNPIEVKLILQLADHAFFHAVFLLHEAMSKGHNNMNTFHDTSLQLLRCKDMH